MSFRYHNNYQTLKVSSRADVLVGYYSVNIPSCSLPISMHRSNDSILDYSDAASLFWAQWQSGLWPFVVLVLAYFHLVLIIIIINVYKYIFYISQEEIYIIYIPTKKSIFFGSRPLNETSKMKGTSVWVHLSIFSLNYEMHWYFSIISHLYLLPSWIFCVEKTTTTIFWINHRK